MVAVVAGNLKIDRAYRISWPPMVYSCMHDVRAGRYIGLRDSVVSGTQQQCVSIFGRVGGEWVKRDVIEGFNCG